MAVALPQKRIIKTKGILRKTGNPRCNSRRSFRDKSHGARVITYLLLVPEDEGKINLLIIYDKTERDNISRNEIETILKELAVRN